jgi:hypothetical protein
LAAFYAIHLLFEVGFYLRFLIPQEFSLLNKVSRSDVSVVSSGSALAQACLCRQQLGAWMAALYANAEMRTPGGGRCPDHYLSWHCSNPAGS